MIAAGSNFDALIINSAAIALVSPVDGNPLMIIPPSTSIGAVSFILSSGFTILVLCSL